MYWAEPRCRQGGFPLQGQNVPKMIPQDPVYTYTNITSATTTVVKTGSGILKKIIVNKLVASGVITIYDNTAASGTKIATITSPGTLLVNQLTLDYGIRFMIGLTIVTSSTDDITVVFM